MDDILAKKNRHLFLEEKDNQNNSFIGNINDVANRKTELDAVAAHIANVDTVGNHIDNVDTVANNISDINDAVDNIATVKTFNDNVNNGTMQYLLEAFTTSLNDQGNAWEIRLTQLGESILATTSAFNYSTVVTISSDIPANGTLILPNSMKYKVGTHMLMVSWNGTVCYAGEQYDEVGAYGVWATSITLKQPAKTGNKIQLRIVALTDQSSYVDITEAAINASQFTASGSNTERYLPEFLGDVVNVKNFGAVGNGVNDDTTAFQSAIASGKAVFVPEGTYKLNTNLSGVFCGVGDSTFTGGTVNGSTILRGIAKKNSDIINVKDFGAKGDGITDDSDAVQIAVDKGGTIYFPKGVYCISKEISVTKAGTRLVGDGMGGGYRADGKTPYTFHTDVTTLLFVENTQNNRSRVRTRYLARPTSASPNDPPMSVCINVQAEHVHIQDLAVKLDITLPAGYLANPASYIGNVTEGVNYGVDLDIGIFIGTRCHFTMRDCMVLGYFRKAGIWADSTQTTNAPRFADADGNTYPDSNVSNGSDGMELYNVLVYGGFWGIRIQGPMPENPDTIYDKFPSDLRPTYYYDSILGESVNDYRGGFGFSDVLLFGCSIYGFCHHTNVLWTDFDPTDSPTEFATTFKYGGALCVSGLAGNPSRRIQGHRYIATRLTGGGAYDVYLGLTNRDLFLGCMLDHEGMYDSSGNAETNWFGGTVLTKNANLVRIIASMCPRDSSYINNTFTESYRVLNFGNEARTWDNYHIPSNLSLGTSDPSEYSDATGITLSMSGRDDKQAHIVFSKITENESAAITTGVIRHYFNGTGSPYMRFWLLPSEATDLTWPLSIQSSPTNHIFSSNSDKNVRVYAPSKKEWGIYSEDSNAVVLRITSDSNNDHYITTRNIVRPYTSATDTLGTGTFRYKTLYISDGAINTSDERLKSNISDFPEEVLEAWGDVKWRQFKMKYAVAEKGEAARLHSGVIAQQIQEAFASKGLDASKYGLFCHDSWDDTYDTVSVVDIPERVVDGEKIPAEMHDEKVLVREKGEEYSIRYEEALVLECAYLRNELKKQNAKIEALMQRISALENNH